MDVKLVVTRGCKRSQTFQLRSEETIIGRQRGCDLRIPSALVSRRHCRLSFRGECLTVEDLASVNGSFLNGIAIEGQQVIRPGDLLEIGPVAFRVEYRLPTRAVQQKEPPVPSGAPYASEVIRLVEEEPASTPALDPQGIPEVIEMAAEVPSPPRRYTEPDSDDEMLPDIDMDEEVQELAAEDDGQTINFDALDWRPPAGQDLRELLSDLDEE